MSYITKGYLATQLKNLSNRISEVFAKKTDVDSALNGKSDTGHTHTKSDVGLGNVDNVRQMPLSSWNWAPGSGQPSWLWGGNEMDKYYVFRPSELEVESAKKDGDGNVIADTYFPLDGGIINGNLGFSKSNPIIRLGDLYINRNGSPNYETRIYGGESGYPHLMLRQYTNVFQFLPNTTYNSGTKEVNIGHSQYRFGDGYFNNVYNSSGVITTSDRNRKHDFEEITDEFSEKIVDGLIPSSFKFNDGSSGRTHFGIIAQDLEKLLEALGISTTDFAPLVKEYPDKEVEIENPDYDENDEKSQKYIKKLEKDYDAEPIYNVRYEEFIMILVKYCQGLKKKDLELEKRLSELEEKVNKLIAG